MKKTFAILLLWAIILPVFAQDTVPNCYDENPLSVNKPYIKSYFTDSWRMLSEPARWQGSDWLKAGAFTATWLLVYTQDEAIYDFFQRNRSPFTDNLAKYFFDPLGIGFYSIPVLASMYVYGLSADEQKPKTVALLGLKAWLISGVATQLIKQITHRHRPHQTHPVNPYLWDGPFSDISYTSFPSGHTVSAFSIATVLAEAYKDRPWVPVVSYSLATMVGLSRINDQEHWATDVLAGAVFGHLVGRFVFRSYINKNCIRLQAMTSNGYPGLSVRIVLN